MKYLFVIMCLLSVVNVDAQTDIWLEKDDTTLNNIWIDSLHCINVHIDNMAKAISFSTLKNNKLAPIGKFKATIVNVDAVRLEDLNGDGIDEIIASTGRNMNGNQWFDIFLYNPQKDIICYSGSFNTDYEMDTVNKTINVTYTGSWYMTSYKKQYVWQGDKLVPNKVISQRLQSEREDCDSVIVEQYKSVPAGSGHLKRTMRKLFAVDDRRKEDMWKHFFDRRNSKL